MKDDPLYDRGDGTERLGPPVQVRNHRMESSIGGVGVGFTIRYVQEYGPRLTAFEVTQALNNAVWEKTRIENDRARKETN
jgi:hypothetical protein|nr:MAG TPA: hypothetical protein [Caudoviricetes sp.]